MKNLDEINFKCIGCNCCAEICPQNAIILKNDEEGFWKYYIDRNKCVNCGLCVNKCPQLNEFKLQNKVNEEVYAVHAKSIDENKKSTSGGAFINLAKAIAQKGNYSIVGCYFDENFVAKHGLINNIDEISKFNGSKYIQSDIRNIYSIVKKELENGKRILFSGTPCQIAGLKMFLGNYKIENLYTVDLICHGVPSPLLFKKYKENLEKKYNSKLVKYEFRSKRNNSWGLYFYYAFDNGIKKSGIYTLDSYYYNFIEGNTYNEACYECKYAKKERVSDVTIGDFWGIENEHPNNNSEYGNSIVMINTEKGKELFENIKKDINYEKSEYKKIVKYNKNLIKPTERKKIRDDIYSDIWKKEYQQIEKENMKYKLSIFNRIKACIPIRIKKTIKKIIKRNY